MKRDLDISVKDKLERLQWTTEELQCCEDEFTSDIEGYPPSHQYDYEQWKKEQKR